MKRTFAFFVAILLGVNIVWAQPEEQSPNIIYILVDDLGYGDVNLKIDSLDVFNNPHIKTPELARLAEGSKVFTHHYAADPVCSPSRAGLLTGRTPTRTNIRSAIATHPAEGQQEPFLSGKEITIAELLQDRGYETAVFGKWHLNGAAWEDKSAWTGWTGSFPNQQGFDYAMVSKGNPHETQTGDINTQKDPASYYLDAEYDHGKPLGKIEGFDSQIIADSAIAWIKEKRKSQRPYFVYIPFGSPHEQVESPVAFNNLYDTGSAFKNRYYANVTHLDSQIGRILDMLYSIQEEENTIIFFSSDNGPEIPLHYWKALYSYGTSAPLFGQKRHLYEGGIRVPGMIRWPSRVEPGISGLPNSTLDVLPTICDIVEIDPPKDRAIDGTSILPSLIDDREIQREKPLYWQTEIRSNWMVEGVGYDRRFDGTRPVDLPTPRVSIRRGAYVLRGFSSARGEEFARPDIFQLYNVVKDRSEMVELSKFEPELFERMKAELLEMWRDVNDDREQTQTEMENKVDQRDS